MRLTMEPAMHRMRVRRTSVRPLHDTTRMETR